MKKIIILLSVLIIILSSTFIIKKETHPPRDTRLILEHTYKSYIAPVCFEDSEATNFLEDSDLEMANKLDYGPHNECTENAMKPVKDKLMISLLKNIGVIKTEWSTW